MFGLGGREMAMMAVSLLIVVSAILAILMPIFVYQIRNRTLDMDKKMSTIIELLGGQDDKKIKICPLCGAKNRKQDHICIKCGKVMGL